VSHYTPGVLPHLTGDVLFGHFRLGGLVGCVGRLLLALHDPRMSTARRSPFSRTQYSRHVIRSFCIGVELVEAVMTP